MEVPRRRRLTLGNLDIQYLSEPECNVHWRWCLASSVKPNGFVESLFRVL